MPSDDFDTKSIKKQTLDRFNNLQKIWPKPLTWRERLSLGGLKYYILKLFRKV